MSEATRMPPPDGPGEDSPPSCFGDPSRVCPKDADGIIQPQVECVSCGVLRNCLQKALQKDGLICDPAQQSHGISKATDFLKRWSRKKLARLEREDASVP